MLCVTKLVFLTNYSAAGRLPRKRVLCANRGPVVMLGHDRASINRVTVRRIRTTLTATPGGSLLKDSAVHCPFPFKL